jgi:hypothetical protein
LEEVETISKLECMSNKTIDIHVHTIESRKYHMADNFRGVLIFVIFMVDLAVMKISTHEI